MIQQRKRQTVHGIVVVLLDIRRMIVDLVQEVIHRHIAADLEGIGVYLGKLGNDLIPFIVDLADQLLQHVLHGNNTEGAAVVIHHNGDMYLLALEFGKQPGDLHAAVNIHRLGHQLFQFKVLIEQGGLQNIPGMNHTDDVIHRFAVYGNTGKAFLGDDLQYLLRGGVLIDGDHIDTGGKDILHGGVIEFQSRLDQLLFLLLQYALLLDGIQHIHQFLLGNGRLLLAVLLFLEGLHEPQEQKAERGKDDHKDTQHPGKRHRNALGVHLGKALGDNFAEGENDKGGNTGGNRNRIIFEVRSGDHCDQ